MIARPEWYRIPAGERPGRSSPSVEALVKKRVVGSLSALLLALSALSGIAAAVSADGARPVPPILSIRDQAAVWDSWLHARLDNVLPELMRREKIDLWLVACREYNEDPVYLSLVPFTSLSARRLSILVFFDRGGDRGVERFCVGRYGIGDLYKTVWDPAKETEWQCLARAVRERNPRRIGIDEGETFAFGDGLSASLKATLVKALGPADAAKLASAERLAVGWLERRSPAEIELYPHIVSIAHAIIAEAFSPAVVVPGVTKAQDVAWWMWEKARSLGLECWFSPSVNLQRAKSGPPAADDVIRRGDVLHCDFGIRYLGLCTDTQQLAYVLREGEDDAPAGLKTALAQGNRLQDIHLEAMATGSTGNRILAAALARAKGEGLRPSVYTHPLGIHGHAAGPVIGLWDRQDGVPGTGDYPLYPDTAFSIELNVRASVPEWGGQDVTVALEQDAIYTKDGARWLDLRPRAFHLIR